MLTSNAVLHFALPHALFLAGVETLNEHEAIKQMRADGQLELMPIPRYGVHSFHSHFTPFHPQFTLL